MRALLLLLPLVLLGAFADTAAARRRHLIVCQDGDGWIYPLRESPRASPCDADGVADGVCTVAIPCPLGIACPPCCEQTIDVPVGKTVRLKRLHVRVRCVAPRPLG